jgi:hypothetical protein
MYMCECYLTLSIKGSYNSSTLVYITYTEEEMVYQKYYCPSYFYTSNNITRILDRVKLSTCGTIIRVIIFDKSVQDQRNIKFARMTHAYLKTDLILYSTTSSI